MNYLQSGEDALTENQAACSLEVYEQYLSTYEDYDNAGDSPAAQKANAAAVRRCDIP